MANSKHPPEAYAALERELAEARAYQAASAEVLRVISSSVADAQPVFEKILDSCEALFDATQLVIALIHDDGQLHIATIRGQGSSLIRQAFPRPVPDSLTALVIAEGRAVHIPDVGAALDTVPASTRAVYDRFGNFSQLLAPLQHGDQALGE